MIFLEKLHKLLDAYDEHSCGTRDKAALYGICDLSPPLATHIVFEPMSKNVMQQMIDDYRNTIPKDLLLIYNTMNGADLFWTVRLAGKANRRIPYSRLSIYGVPLTWDRKHIEPYNIRIEDLNRPRGTPESWLKFGSYYRPNNVTNRLDLFADTKNGGAFAVEHDKNECCVIETWDSIDSCLCFVFDLLAHEA